MRNFFSVGPISLRISRRSIASWGYASLQFGGLSIWTRDSGGGLTLASYHPRKSQTWHWSIGINRYGEAIWPDGWIARAAPEWRHGQWHDYYRLPFGWQLRVSQQDYHCWPARAA